MTQPNYTQINTNPQNNSSSKQLYSFPKQIRFTIKKQHHFNNRTQTQTTTIPSSQRVRNHINRQSQIQSHSQSHIKACSFSREKRQLKFENQQQYRLHPSPSQYIYSHHPNSQSINNINNNNTGITMGIKLKTLQLLTKQKSNTPAPNTYKSQSFDRLNKSIIFSREKRVLKYPIDNQKGKDTPGPYLLIQTQKLKQVLSSYVNPRATKIINKKSNNLEFNSLKIKLKMKHQLSNNNINNNNSNDNETKQNKSKSKQKQSNITRKNNKSMQEAQSNLKKLSIYRKQLTTVFGKQVKKSIFDIKNPNPSPNKYLYFSEFAQRNKPDVKASKSSRISLTARIQHLSKSKIKNKSQEPKIDLKQKFKTLPAAL